MTESHNPWTEDGEHVKSAYSMTLGYHYDGGWTVFPGHKGDSEFLIVEVDYLPSTDRWMHTRTYMSAHQGSGWEGESGWWYQNWRHNGLMQYPTKTLGYHRVWVSKEKHANYGSEGTCDSEPGGCSNGSNERVSIRRQDNIGENHRRLLLWVRSRLGYPGDECSQARSAGHHATQRQGNSCDPVWDGAIFGVLPGILAAGLLVNISQWEPRSDRTVVAFSAALGALGGLLIDGAACNAANGEGSERRSLLERSRAFESAMSGVQTQFTRPLLNRRCDFPMYTLPLISGDSVRQPVQTLLMESVVDSQLNLPGTVLTTPLSPEQQGQRTGCLSINLLEPLRGLATVSNTRVP